MRKELTKEELKNIKASDLSSIRLTQNEKILLKEINLQRERERTVRAANLSKEEQPILDDLDQVGIKVNSIWDLVNGNSRSTDAVPVLINHLTLAYSDRTREGVARAIAAQDLSSSDVWDVLKYEYINAPSGFGQISPEESDHYRLGAKDGIACALVACARREHLPELIELLKDKLHGDSRIFLLGALFKLGINEDDNREIIEYIKKDPLFLDTVKAWEKR